MNHEAADGGRAEDDSNMEPPPIDDDVDDDNATDTGSDDDENEEEDDDEEDTSSDDESVVIPTPDDVEHEFTYPQDFEGKSWEDVVPSGQYFRLILDPSCTNIPDGKFKGCGRLIEIVVPEDSCLRMIGISSFYWCTNLQRITNGLPTTLLIIDRSAFYGCAALKGPLVIPSNVIRLGMEAFAFCASLTSIVFEPSTATTTPGIGPLCFSNCTGLLSVDLSERIDEYGNFSFYNCTSLKRIIIRAPSVRFGTEIFSGCSSLLTIEAYPWLYPKIFASMNNNPSLIYQTFHEYHHRILGEATIADDGVVTRQHPNGRRRRQLHKRQRLRR